MNNPLQQCAADLIALVRDVSDEDVSAYEEALAAAQQAAETEPDREDIVHLCQLVQRHGAGDPTADMVEATDLALCILDQLEVDYA
jgi:hypothetical protein